MIHIPIVHALHYPGSWDSHTHTRTLSSGIRYCRCYVYPNGRADLRVSILENPQVDHILASSSSLLKMMFIAMCPLAGSLGRKKGAILMDLFFLSFYTMLITNNVFNLLGNLVN